MEKNFESTPYYRNTAGAADGWLSGLSKAAAARNLPTQLCSDSARDVIASVALPAVMVRELGVVTNAPTASKPEPESGSVSALEPEPESEPVVHDDG